MKSHPIKDGFSTLILLFFFILVVFFMREQISVFNRIVAKLRLQVLENTEIFMNKTKEHNIFIKNLDFPKNFKKET